MSKSNVFLIESAIGRFYSSGDNEAHSWLLQVQTSKEAWNDVWHLLDPSKSSEVRFFGATTIHEKISKQWNEIPESEYSTLRSRLIEVLKYPGTSNVVLTRLCKAFAAFISKYFLSQPEEKRKCMVEELLEILPCNSIDTVELLLQVLEAIPREFEKSQGVKQIKIRETLLVNWRKTGLILQQIFSSNNIQDSNTSDKLLSLTLNCTLSWFRIGQLPLDSIDPLYPYLLLAGAHYIPNRDDLDGDCSNIWETTQECLSMVLTHSDLYKRPQLLWEWAKNFMCIVHQQGEKYYYEIIAAIGEAHSRSILIALSTNCSQNEKWVSENLIEFLLRCSEQEGRYPTEEKQSCIPFGFWYLLQDDLGTLDKPLDNQAKEVLKPIYIRLSLAMIKKSALPTTSEEAGTSEEQELFRKYREDVSDTLIYCHNVLGKELLILLGQKLGQFQNNISNWTEVEAVINGFKAIADSADVDCQYIPAIMDMILTNIPYAAYPKQVLSTACLTIADYAEWIGSNPDPWLEKSLKLIEVGLTLTAAAASIALKDISRECKTHLAPIAPSILETISQTLPSLTPGSRESLRLMYAAGKLIPCITNSDEQFKHLEQILGLSIISLRELLLRNPDNETQVTVCNRLKMIATFLTVLEGSIGKTVIDALMPIFERIIVHPQWSKDIGTLDAMFICASKSSSSLTNPEMAKPFLCMLITSYKIQPHPQALNFLKQLLLLFGKDQDNNVGSIFNEVSALTLAYVNNCQQVNGNISELSDLLIAYFELLAQVCKKNAKLLLQIPDQVPEMFHCGIRCLQLPEEIIVKTAGSFLNHAITQSPHIQTFIQPIGQELVCVIIQCIAGTVLPNHLQPHAEVLIALNKTCVEWNSQWIKYALSTCIRPEIPQTVKDKFTQDILCEHCNKKRLFQKLKQFNFEIAQYVNKS